jgi:hypothetical protein
MAEPKSVPGLKQKNASVIDVMSLFGHSLTLLQSSFP